MFFELIQVALGNKEKLSSTPSVKDWNALFLESKKQSVVGIAFEGLQKLPQEQWPPQHLVLQWIGYSQQIQRRNAILNERCVELLSRLSSAGLHPTILKGQGIARYYSPTLQCLRQAGDIDVYVNDGREKAISFAKTIGQESIDWDYKHLHLQVWDDTEVEMHYHVEVLLNLWKNRKLHKWFREHEAELFAHANDNLNENTGGMTTPMVEFNVFYILLHIYRHFLYEGVGLRQIVDYYFVLKNLNLNDNHNHNESYAYKAVGEFGMEKFAMGLMWVMQEALGMPREWMLWEADEKEGRYILEQVITGGNFGHYDKRLKHSGGKLGSVKAILTHNLHLLIHYPSDVIWAPVWIVWHKWWKLTRV